MVPQERQLVEVGVRIPLWQIRAAEFPQKFLFAFLCAILNENEPSTRLMAPDTSEWHGSFEVALHPGTNTSLFANITISSIGEVTSILA